MTLSQALADAVWLLRHEPEQYPEALRRLDELTLQQREVEQSHSRMPARQHTGMWQLIEGGKA